MKEISIYEILLATGGKLVSGNTNDIVDSVCIDSRKVTKGALFVPLIGEKTDGHKYIQSAFESGAKVSFCQPDRLEDADGGAIIEVDSTLDALQKLAKYYRNKFTIPFIGVSGSVGKTTTKEMIATVLSENLKVLKTEGNYNGQIGLPMTIFNLDDTHEAAVLEMGVSKFGEMEKLADIANIDIAVITNIGLSHIENFKDMKNTCVEKLKMIKKDNGIILLNGDSPVLAEAKLENSLQRIIFFGMNGSYPYKFEDISFHSADTEFTLVTDNFKDTVLIPCLGMHNVYNALAAIGVAVELGIHFEDIKRGLMKFKNVGMRQQIFNLGDIVLIDDSYNASPDSVKSSAKILRNINSEGKNVLVIADMLELGARSKEIHFDTGRYIAIEGVDVLITIGTHAKYLSDGALSVKSDLQSYHCNENKEAFEILKNILEKNDKVLVKGSRGMHTDEISAKIKEYYSE
ncbi:MAG: UDP-N-acetylmuramoyl-tripeptide--D-alanyl-D-alanine ligase [Acutalibacteraceae bacterium]